MRAARVVRALTAALVVALTSTGTVVLAAASAQASTPDTAIRTATRTDTPKPTPTRTPSPTASTTPTRTAKPTPSPSRTPKPTTSPTRTAKPTPSPSRTPKPSASPTRTAKATPSRTPTASPKAAATPTATRKTSSASTAVPRHQAHFPTGRLTAVTLVPTLAKAMLDVGSISVTTRTSDALGPVETTVDVDMVMSNSRIRESLPEGQVEIRTVDGRRYLQSAATGDMFYLAKADDTLGRLAVGVDPVRPVRALFGAIVDVHTTGAPVTLDGVTTQAYEVVVATARLQDGLGDLGAGIARDQLPPTVTLTFWIDQQDRLRRATSNIAGTPVEVLFTNWGADFGIAAPPQVDTSPEWPPVRPPVPKKK